MGRHRAAVSQTGREGRGGACHQAERAAVRRRQHQGMPITSMAAASASLQSKTVVPERRKSIGEVRNDVLEFLDQHNFKCVPSVSNCFMVDTKRPARDVISAMAREKVIRSEE